MKIGDFWWKSKICLDFRLNILNFRIFAKNHYFSLFLIFLTRCIPPLGYLNIQKKPGNRIFRNSRCGLNKIPSKNIDFSKSYGFSKKSFFLIFLWFFDQKSWFFGFSTKITIFRYFRFLTSSIAPLRCSGTPEKLGNHISRHSRHGLTESPSKNIDFSRS